ncbi:alpha/beta fold hydrolase [Rothia kristinae]|uniref:alpha/beta fold hydrolase n=1 Tax=Rothia kristinae TaxID=37923 RepID=UPI0021A31690|nr:alpha/beta hydrolase [Rothia kristinae]MCT1356375.1 alpha/beta hydrolase [Rothia kristinae]MCT1392932.1 alpha/beta hydrolase [Rothia kristinae]MCT1505630.1 alpha/beta hydrolase [Rothia kristinae]MCT2038142.1 alpha/beta hydrolase [Rothia kristinae]MCT2243285.1 alpha/beta hydrolase [Rothia kristinae]
MSAVDSETAAETTGAVERHTITTSDGVRLSYTDEGAGRPVVMIHGWTFSGRFFDGVALELARGHRVIRLDLRGHGRSESPDHGYRMSRLSADLHELLEALDLREATLIGWSLGCPIIWGLLESFGSARVAQAVYIDQTPAQYRTADWPWAHAQCWDDAALAGLQAAIAADPAGQDREQVPTILQREPTERERELFLAEMGRCRPEVRNAVMQNHTRLDWRDVIPHLSVPALVRVARRNVVFDWRGPHWVAEHLPDARERIFEDSRHALFLDEPQAFVEAVREFLAEADR